jgi:DNA-binding NtrC family response regulator
VSTTVLIVDDEETIRFALTKYLSAAGYAVVPASTGRAAREAMRASAPDVIILDYRLPDCDSLEIIPELKYIDAECPIIMLTAHGSIDLAVEAIKAGAEQFITKPVELAALRLLVDRVTANRRTRKRDAAARAKQGSPGHLFRLGRPQQRHRLSGIGVRRRRHRDQTGNRSPRFSPGIRGRPRRRHPRSRPRAPATPADR